MAICKTMEQYLRGEISYETLEECVDCVNKANLKHAEMREMRERIRQMEVKSQLDLFRFEGPVTEIEKEEEQNEKKKRGSETEESNEKRKTRGTGKTGFQPRISMGG